MSHCPHRRLEDRPAVVRGELRLRHRGAAPRRRVAAPPRDRPPARGPGWRRRRPRERVAGRGARRPASRRSVRGGSRSPTAVRVGSPPAALAEAPEPGPRGALGSRRPPTNAATVAAAMASAASPARFHIFGRSRVVTTGSGGSPYTSGSSSSRKNAPSPPTPSFGSWPYSRASVTPALVQRAPPAAAARSRSSSSGAVLDRLGRARLRARRRHARAEPVVAQRALPRPAVALALVDHPVRAGGDAVAAAVADVLLHHHGAELGAEQRTGRADVQAGRVRCSACTRPTSSASGSRCALGAGAAPRRLRPGHAEELRAARPSARGRQSAAPGGSPASGDRCRCAGAGGHRRRRGAGRPPVGCPRTAACGARPAGLLDERDVPPGVRGQRAGVVVRHAQQVEPGRPGRRSTPCRPPRTPCSRCRRWCR